MPKTKISEYSTTNTNNSDIEGINIAEGCAPSGINNAIREIMVHLKEFQTGDSGDPLTVAGTFVASGSATINGTTIPASKTLADTDSAQTFTNKTISGSANTLTNISLTTAVTGTLPLANGGTGQTSAQAAINSLAGATTSGQYLRGNGTNVVMSAIQVADVPTLNQNTTGTASNVTGTVAVANGGTGLTTLTANNVILGNGTSTPTFVAPGTSGNVLTSNGTTWVSQAAGASLLGDTDSATPFETSLGFEAGNSATGVNNTFIGYQAGKATTTGTNNTAVGYQSLDVNTTGVENSAVGSGALGANTGGASNNAMGYLALAANTTANGNCAFGNSALTANTTGGENNAFGLNALTTNTTGSRNIAFGSSALQSNTTGANNVAVGHDSLAANTIGLRNTTVGYQSLDANTTGNDNTAVGSSALGANTTGIRNTAVGSGAGDEITTGTGNTILGYNASASAATGVDQIVIGNGVTGQADTNVTIGNGTGKIYNAYTVNATWTQTSDERLKRNIQDDTLGLSFINRLRPVKYQWKPSNEIDPSLPYYDKVNKRDTERVMHGLVAQEVKAALDAEGVSTFAGWDQGPDTIQAISREMFISPLIKAIQELSAQVEQLKAEIEASKGN